MLTMEQQEALVAQGLATKKINPDLGLVTYKYAKKVMYDYLWDKHPELLMCRGHVYDLNTGELVIAAPKKSFNYLENGTWEGKPISTLVYLYKKYNGFMACATMHNGQLVVSTTGNTSGKYAEWAKEYVSNYYEEESKHCTFGVMPDGVTDLFEIIHPEDPHIVHEEVGAEFLGWTNMYSMRFTPAPDRARTHQFTSLGVALDLVKTVKHEGFMVYDLVTGEVCKLKSPYYIGKKKLMRMTDKKIDELFANPVQYFHNNMPQEWQWFIPVIKDCLTADIWKVMKEQQRRAFIEGMEQQ